MEMFAQDDLKVLLEERLGPHVSVYIPTHPGGGEENRIRWRNAIARARKQLVDQGLREPDVERFLAPAWQLLEDIELWRNTSEGLAWFQAADFVRRYRLPLAFAETVDCSPHFFVKPLLPLLVGDGRFFVLALSQKGLRLLHGSRQAVSTIDLTRIKGIPSDLADALKYDEKFEPLTFHTRPTGGLGSWAAIFHGHGVGIDDHKNDLLRYFQQIDRGLRAILKQQTAPLVLASVEFLWPLYRQANSYRYLLDHGAAGNPDGWSARELHDRAWQIVQPHFAQRIEQALAQYDHLRGTDRTTDDLEELVPAAVRGQLETLFIAADRLVWGGVDSDTQRIWIHAERQVADEDLLNFAAIRTLAHGRTVYSLPAERMPGKVAAAGIYCLPLAKHQGKRP